ncbi:MAG: hypothetical protein B6D35_01385 [Candidatus Brocadia sp. UTAMX2]|nr:MAG: hypothetical protein B6D35_01385 [Candidatus Brocadia sp. UTAMX2]
MASPKKHTTNTSLECFSAILWMLRIVIILLLREIQYLRKRLASHKKNSSNSHKPPSRDDPFQKRGVPKRGASGRKPGGQKGHPGKARVMALPGQISQTIPHKPQSCKRCGISFGESHESVPAQKRQVWEIPEIKPSVIEHVFYSTTCSCGHRNRPDVPEWMYSGTGENLQALIAYLTGEGKLSRRIRQSILENVFHVPLALGAIQNRLEDTSHILQGACAELENELTNQPVVNIDETGYPHNKTLAWLWVFVTNSFALFTIRASRGSQVIRSVLGELFDGIIISDRFSAYLKYHKDRTCGLLQLCWAHIIRDVKALCTEPAYGSSKPFSLLMRQRIGTVFRIWHAHKHNTLSREQLIALTQPILLEMRSFLENNRNAPSQAVSKFSCQLLKKWEHLFVFLSHQGVEPTNNLTERSIRPAVQSRKL